MLIRVLGRKKRRKQEGGRGNARDYESRKEGERRKGKRREKIGRERREREERKVGR